MTAPDVYEGRTSSDDRRSPRDYPSQTRPPGLPPQLHGLGYEVHEDPFISEGYTAPLEAGMVVTIEPGVYLPGETGVRIEDTVLITEGGCEVFDTTTRELLVL